MGIHCDQMIKLQVVKCNFTEALRRCMIIIAKTKLLVTRFSVIRARLKIAFNRQQVASSIFNLSSLLAPNSLLPRGGNCILHVSIFAADVLRVEMFCHLFCSIILLLVALHTRDNCQTRRATILLVDWAPRESFL